VDTVSENLTEEQQVEELKKWWKENGRSIIFGGIIGIALIGGWRGWQGYQDSQAEQGAALYDKFTTHLANQQGDAARSDRNALVDDFSGTVYVDFANLQMAKSETEAGNIDAAILRLQDVIADGSDEGLMQLASLRLARLYLGQEKIAEARQALAGVTDTAFEGESLAIEGRIAFKEGNREAARIALEAAREKGAADSEMIGYLLQQLETPKS
jgi:predicted negative regulator of RcsB-dependent stress response